MVDNTGSLKKPKYNIQQFEDYKDSQDEAEHDQEDKMAEKMSFQEKVKFRKASEMQFDAFLSGTSATLMVQIDRAPKRVYAAWVGDAKFIIGAEIQKQG